MENDQVYPLKYAKLIVKDKAARMLEAGCGAGRILRYYHEYGYWITGFDFISSAVTNLKRNTPSLEILVADIVRLPFVRRQNLLDLGLPELREALGHRVVL